MFFKICFCFVLLYNKSLMTGPLENGEFCFPQISMFHSTLFQKTQILGKQNSLFLSEPVVKT